MNGTFTTSCGTGRQGIALIIVLSFVVLISALIIAFFTSVSTELAAAKSYANGITARQLADSAAQISMAAVRQATAGTSGTVNLAWASQPGMIRTYDDSGAPKTFYKLYSSDQMSVTTFPFDPAAEIAASWKTDTARYTDLNAPVTVDTTPIYPILDPGAQTLVKGFTISNAPGYDGTKSPSAVNNPAPMPTKWMYVLNNGQLTAPTGVTSGGKTATWTGAGVVPTAANPIVGRIAFWTDDDTSKVNINTAAGDVWTDTLPAVGAAGNPGSFWDTPRTGYQAYEKTILAQYQPAQNEFQRYPGHPATTYLSAVFPSLTTANVYQIAPRVAPGGSNGGTGIATGPITKDSNRLYSSVDELLFDVTRQTDPTKRDSNPSLTDPKLYPARFFLTAHSRAPEVNLYNQPRVVTWPISATNDAAHRTPFDKLIAFCGTLNAQANTNYYYFQRSNADSQTVDLPSAAAPTGLGRNRALISYLRKLTGQAVPGFGGNFQAKYGSDRDQILTEIFDYIRALNAQDTSVPGLVPYAPTASGSVNGTVGSVAGQGQIVPITDVASAGGAGLRGFGRFPTIRDASVVFVGVGQTSGSKKSIPPDASQAPNNGTTGVPIADGKTRVQAFFTVSLFDPSQGFAICRPNFKIRVTGLDGFQWAGQPMQFPSPSTVDIKQNYDSSAYGGYNGASSFVEPAPGEPGDAAVTNIYRMVSSYIDLPTTTGGAPASFAFGGGSAKVEFLDKAGTTVLQTLNLTFPPATIPVPLLALELDDPINSPYEAGTYLKADFRSLTPAYVGSFASRPNPSSRFTGGNTNTNGSECTKTWISSRDVIRSVVANTDPRLIAAMQTVPSTYFSAAPGYSDASTNMAHGIAESINGGSIRAFNGCWIGRFVPNVPYGVFGQVNTEYYPLSGTFTSDGLQPITYPNGMASNPVNSGGPTGTASPVAFGMRGANCVAVNGVYAGTNATDGTASGFPPGDWDNGFSVTPDGAFINKADEGNIYQLTAGKVPYFDNLAAFQSSGGTFFTPNRQMPSAAMFGSLPTGVIANRPWQTLLFHPDPNPNGTTGHAGVAAPKDHLILDLFNMPVVEPYAISDPFSTAGKINMNYQIVPYDYLKRTTGVRAVLRAEQLLTLPASNTNSVALFYKNQGGMTTAQSQQMKATRVGLDLDETLKGFQKRFDDKDIFRSASEVCDIYLVPQGQNYNGMPAFWNDNLLTGDNSRERPYANIYPRLTTKSNTFTVHYRVQTLKKVVGTDAAQWVEGRDAVTAEQRGSSTFERYLDTDDTTIPDYAAATSPAAIDKFYKFRTVEIKQFAP